MLLHDTLSIIIPAYNEAGNLELALDDLLDILKNDLDKVEILIFNDASTDNTGEIADEYAARFPCIKVIHNNPNCGLGYNYRKGVEMASKNYIMMVPGDREIEKDSIKTIMTLIGFSDIVIPFIQNYKIRPLLRQALSKSFTMTVNAISGLNITYFNGPVVHKASLLKARKINTDGFAYQAELLVKMILEGATFTQVSMMIQPRQYGVANALNIQNILRVNRTLIDLIKYRFFGKK